MIHILPKYPLSQPTSNTPGNCRWQQATEGVKSCKWWHSCFQKLQTQFQWDGMEGWQLQLWTSKAPLRLQFYPQWQRTCQWIHWGAPSSCKVAKLDPPKLDHSSTIAQHFPQLVYIRYLPMAKPCSWIQNYTQSSNKTALSAYIMSSLLKTLIFSHCAKPNFIVTIYTHPKNDMTWRTGKGITSLISVVDPQV